MLFSLGGNTVDVDIEKTKAIYEKLPYIWQRCQCPACRNLEERFAKMDSEKYSGFKEMGVDIEKCVFAWPYEPGKRPFTQRYILRYPLVCTEVETACPNSLEEAGKELSAGFAAIDGGVFLVLDCELKWSGV